MGEFSPISERAGAPPVPPQERTMPSFDTVLDPDLVEVKNAVDQTAKEIGTRFDFKGSSSRVEL
jgi:hypothetical protein